MRMGRFADGEGGYSVEKREHGERVDRELSWVNGTDCAGGRDFVPFKTCKAWVRGIKNWHFQAK